MAYEFTGFSALKSAGFDDIIDVRAPAEFAEDHLPGAINLPVLSDAERAEVGTIYKQDTPFNARKRGAALVARNAAAHLDGPLADRDGGWRPLVYCWRGGQRSGSFASILSQIGWRVEVLKGGYQSYRRHVVDRLYSSDFPVSVLLLDGDTGTAKTEVLARLAAHNVQTLDLEAMAFHRGSALGGRGDQPGQKAFESVLAAALSQLDPTRPVLIEAESSRIGQINLPPSLFAAMRAAPRLRIEAPVEARARYLCAAYSDLTADPVRLVERLQRLVRLQGHEQVHRWSRMVDEKAFAALAQELIVAHYDPRYAKVRRAASDPVAVVRTDHLDEAGIAKLTAEVADVVARV